jgi:hypothetical protein
MSFCSWILFYVYPLFYPFYTILVNLLLFMLLYNNQIFVHIDLYSWLFFIYTHSFPLLKNDNKKCKTVSFWWQVIYNVYICLIFLYFQLADLSHCNDYYLKQCCFIIIFIWIMILFIVVLLSSLSESWFYLLLFCYHLCVFSTWFYPHSHWRMVVDYINFVLFNDINWISDQQENHTFCWRSWKVRSQVFNSNGS